MPAVNAVPNRVPTVSTEGGALTTATAGTFVIDLDGIAHIIDTTHTATPPSTRCYRSIWKSWTADDDPPLVCGRCVQSWMNT